MAASSDAASLPTGSDPSEAVAEDDIRALIALAALGGPDRLAHHERLALGRALEASPGLRAELRALAAVAAALPPAPPPATRLDRVRAAIPPGLRRPEVVAALAAAVLLLGVARLATAGPTGGESVVTATVATIDATTAVVDRPWGVEVRLTLDGTRPGEGYEVTVSDQAGGRVAVGSFAGEDGPVRFTGTAAVTRDELAGVRVTDASGDVVLRAELP